MWCLPVVGGIESLTDYRDIFESLLTVISSHTISRYLLEHAGRDTTLSDCYQGESDDTDHFRCALSAAITTCNSDKLAVGSSTAVDKIANEAKYFPLLYGIQGATQGPLRDLIAGVGKVN